MLDSLITSLTKHTLLLSPLVPQASIAFGADEMSCMATETMFELANRCPSLSRCSCALPRLHSPATTAPYRLCYNESLLSRR